MRASSSKFIGTALMALALSACGAVGNRRPLNGESIASDAKCVADNLSEGKAIEVALAHYRVDTSKEFVNAKTVLKSRYWGIRLEFDPPTPGNSVYVEVDFCGKVIFEEHGY